MKNILSFLLVVTAIGIAFSSCKNTAVTDTQLPEAKYKPPVIHNLKFNSVKKIDPNSIKTILIRPDVKKIGFNKLPEQTYDTAASRPVHFVTEETKIDYGASPEQNFDISKLPSKILKFSTIKLQPPKLIKSGQPHLKDAGLSLYELAENQGLQGVLISCVFSDSKGFLWIATSEGLYRYDGENLLSYISGPMDTYFMGMVEDKRGRLWLSTLNGGLEIFDQANGTLKKAPAPATGSNNICHILQDRQQRIWASSYSPDGINIIDPETLSVKWLDKSHGLTDSRVNGLTMDHAGKVWISTFKGINIINTATGKIKVLAKSNGLKSDTTGVLFCDHNGNIWMNNSGANVFNPQSLSFKTIKQEKFFKKNLVLGFSEDNRGRIWIASQRNGLGILDLSNHTLQSLDHKNGLDGDFVLNIYPDKQSQVWVATLKGLNKVSYNNSEKEHIGTLPIVAQAYDAAGLIWSGTFKGLDIINSKTRTYRHLGTQQGLTNDSVQCMSRKYNKMYLGSNGGLGIVDSSRNTITHIGVKQGLTGTPVESIMVDRNDNVWLGELKTGIDIFNPKNNTLKHIGKAQGLIDAGVIDIKQDKKGDVWVTTNSDIYKIDADLKIIRSLHVAKGNNTVLIDNHRNTWIGTQRGLFIADPMNKQLISFSTEQGLISNQVISLLKYGNQIYAGTLKGITIITPPDDSLSTDKKWGIRSFGARYGLEKANTGYLLTDMITGDGLYCWGDNGVSIYDLSKKDTSVSSVYITGINVMDGHQYFTGNSHTAAGGLKFDNVTGPYNLPVNLQLPYNQNYVQLNYAVLNTTPHDTTWYLYRLNGADKDWNPATASTTSKSYYNLPPGEYTFEVAAKTADEGWSKTASLSFTINSPWWQTWWAYIIYIALFGGIIWGFVHFRSRRLMLDKRLLEDKVKLRTEEVLQQKEEIEAQRDNLEKAFVELKTAQNQLIQSEKMASLGELTAGIAHEIQNPLNFVNNFSEVNTELIGEMQEEIDKGNYEEVKEIANDIRGNQEKINQHGKRADFIVKGMLQHSRTNTGERQQTDVNVLADEFLKLSYHGIRAKDKNFNAEMVKNFEPALPTINIVQQDIGRVLLNLFNNAFYAVNEKNKTGGADYKPEVSVTTKTTEGHIIVRVKDNGIGIPDAIKDKIMQPFFTTKPTGEGTGLGLSLTYDMVVKGHGGSITVNSTEGEGTEFIIGLPLN